MLHLYYARRLSVDTITSISSVTTVTIDENETDVESLFSITLRTGNIHKEYIPHPPQLTHHEELTHKTKEVKQRKKSLWKQVLLWFVAYLIKFRGLGEARPKRIAWHEYFWSFLGSFIGILIISEMHYHLLVP